MTHQPPTLAIVIPCYNEQEALPLSLPVLLTLLDDMTARGMVKPDSYLLCINDGSRDTTWQVLEEFHLKDNRVKAIDLAHNRGHQNALLAGLNTVTDRCDAAVSIDADLQDDTRAICDMVRNYLDGDDIVYGVRSSRTTDTWFKRTTAHGFYTFQRKMGLETIYDHADFRLMSNRALQMLAQYGESNLFLRGIIPNIGLRHSTVTYGRTQRIAGQSKYPLSKMLSLSIDGITSFSARPMRWIFLTGLSIMILVLLVGLWALIAWLSDATIPGWTSIMMSVWFLGGLILMGLGIVGEYIGKIFIEVKHRPRYAVSDMLWD